MLPLMCHNDMRKEAQTLEPRSAHPKASVPFPSNVFQQPLSLLCNAAQWHQQDMPEGARTLELWNAPLEAPAPILSIYFPQCQCHALPPLVCYRDVHKKLQMLEPKLLCLSVPTYFKLQHPWPLLCDAALLYHRDMPEEARTLELWNAPFALLVHDDSKAQALEYANKQVGL